MRGDLLLKYSGIVGMSPSGTYVSGIRLLCPSNVNPNTLFSSPEPKINITGEFIGKAATEHHSVIIVVFQTKACSIGD